MRIKSLKMVFVERIIRHKLCMIYAFFVQKSFLTKKFLLFAEINLTTQGPLYTCLVSLLITFQGKFDQKQGYVRVIHRIPLSQILNSISLSVKILGYSKGVTLKTLTFDVKSGKVKIEITVFDFKEYV